MPGKIIRNTTFTVVVLVLTALALNWNHDIVKQHRAELAKGNIVAATSSVVNPFLPLEITQNSTQIRIGQTYTATISSRVGAQVKVALKSSQKGGLILERTTQIDKTGKYVFLQKMEDYNFLGRVEVEVTSTLDSLTSTKTDSFLLDTWGRSLTEEIPPTYVYPLVP